MVMHGTNNQPDVTLGAGDEGTAKETYSKDEVAKLIRDARTAVGADVGRMKAEAEKALKAATDAQDRLNKLAQEQMEAELERFKDDPAEQRRIRAERKAKEVEAELARAKAELDAKNERLQGYESEKQAATKNQTAKAVAERLGVNAEQLIKLSKFTDGSESAIEEIAAELPKVNSPRSTGRPDSGANRGGSQTFTRQQIANMSIEEYTKRHDDIQQAYREGKVK